MTHVAWLKFQGGGESLEILYNVMQRPVDHDQCAKCSKTHLRSSLISKFFSGDYTSGLPLTGGGEEGRGKGEGLHDG